MASLSVAVALFVGGLAVLLWSADLFTDTAQKIGLALGLSPFVIGMTVVAIGTSLPELVAAVLAVLRDEPGIVVGNVVGSNVSNVFLVLGIAAVVGRGLRVERDLMQVDLPLFAASAAFLTLAIWSSPFTSIEGVLALGALAVYIHFTIAERDVSVPEIVEEVEEVEADIEASPIGVMTYAAFVGSLVLVVASASVLVDSVVTLSSVLAVEPAVIAVTALSIGTVLPELTVSAMAARRGDTAVAVGAILGSNVVNAFGVMGVASLVGPLTIPPTIRAYGLPAMVLATVLYLFVTQDREVTRWEGATLVLLYLLFLVNLASVT
ncbi:calcium/sodium antiporter [Halorientalis pallida]|uniref:Calcium/sodium antiporter n=1 Tax=Halorientalis pallida TaxID=2479928 RepID=A0A498KU47_9EURY|nr:calcium/sodium antiporter [Halorientalis pallida]RXK48492.1 calcium/sodium antiporter [Halorientalis pallida]